MKQLILDLIKQHPKHYTHYIKKDRELMKWIEDNHRSLATSSLLTKIFSAINKISTTCRYNNQRSVTRLNNGLNYCGHASVCKCLTESLTESMSNIKQSLTVKEHEQINNKRKKTMQEKFGVDFNSQRPEVIEKLKSTKLPSDVYSCLSDKDWLHNEYVIKQRTSVDIAKELGVYYSTVLFYCNLHNFKIRQFSNYSLIEREIAEYINSMGFITELNSRKVLNGKELDIYVPEKKIGIEVNGLYWHSSSNDNKLKYRHINKTKLANEANIELMHVTDYEWSNKKSIIISMIQSKLGKNSKVYARQTDVKFINTQQAKEFFNESHLNGFIGASYYVAIIYNNEIISAISCGASRYAKNETELLRFASAKGYTVVGGLSKMLKFISRNTDITKIVTYCDRSKSNGDVYNTVGFKFVRYTSLGFYWTDGNNVISRYMLRNNGASKLLPTYDNCITQEQNMFNNKYKKYWDCGNSVWELSL